MQMINALVKTQRNNVVCNFWSQLQIWGWSTDPMARPSQPMGTSSSSIEWAAAAMSPKSRKLYLTVYRSVTEKLFCEFRLLGQFRVITFLTDAWTVLQSKCILSLLIKMSICYFRYSSSCPLYRKRCPSCTET